MQPLKQEKTFRTFLRSLHRERWVVYSQPPFGGPEYVLHYLARYTHRVAISNHRLVSLADGKVTFRWKDYAHGNKKRLMTLAAEEFVRRFLLHVLPRGFVRIRFFGFLANRRRGGLLSLCRQLLAAQAAPAQASAQASASAGAKPASAPSLWRCPQCGGPMVVVERLCAPELHRALAGLHAPPDTS